MADDSLGNVRLKENLKIEIAEAKNICKDNPKDTFCKVAFDQEQVYATDVVEKCSDPLYSSHFSCDIPRKIRALVFSVCEKNNKNDKVIGQVVIKKEELYELHSKVKWFELQPAGLEIQGQVELELEFTESVGHRGSPQVIRRGVRVRLIQCKDLMSTNGQCNPLACITLWRGEGHKNEQKLSKGKKKTNAPFFDENYFFELERISPDRHHSYNGEQDLNASIKISLWHDDSRMSWPAFTSKPTGVFLGEVIIPLKDIEKLDQRKAWWLLQRAQNIQTRRASLGVREACGTNSHTDNQQQPLGSLRVKICYNADHVFSTKHYDPLRQLLLKSHTVHPISASAAYILNEIVDPLEDVASPLVQLLFVHQELVPFIRALASFEIQKIENSQDSNTLFRGNSFASKVIDETMKLVGLPYLQDTLKALVDEVIASRKPCEIDPARIPAAENLQANTANLEDYVQRTFDAIVHSGLRCPMTMCETFYALREATLEQFPTAGVQLRHQVVSGFVFLRFFALAILNPRIFQLTTEIMDPMTTRTLTLISKSIQSLGNLVSAKSHAIGYKEEYMRPLFVKLYSETNLSAIKSFLDIISSLTRMSQPNIDEPVVLKEGFLVKRAQKNNRFILKLSKFKQRYFVLTNKELSYSKKRNGPSSCNLPINSILAVEELEKQSFTRDNMFQIIVKPERPLYVQADNCVVATEWKHILNKVCTLNKKRLKHYHPAAFVKGHWLCCKRADINGKGCQEATASVPADINIDLDSDRNIERMYSLFVATATKIDDLLDRCNDKSEVANGSVTTPVSQLEISQPSPSVAKVRIDNVDMCRKTLEEIKRCVSQLEEFHDIYASNRLQEAKLGSQEFPYGDEIHLSRVPSTQALQHV